MDGDNFYYTIFDFILESGKSGVYLNYQSIYNSVCNLQLSHGVCVFEKYKLHIFLYAQ